MRGIPGNFTVNILDVEEPPIITTYPEVVAIPEDVAVGTVIAEVYDCRFNDGSECIHITVFKIIHERQRTESM